MNKDRFHNELAMLLGYERIVKDNRILISVEDSDDPWVILKVQGYYDIRIKASSNNDDLGLEVDYEIRKKIKDIVIAVHQAYNNSCNFRF